MASIPALAAYEEHLKTVVGWATHMPPMRAKVDRQSFDELKPTVDRALAVLDWFEQLQQQFAACLGALGPGSSAAELAPLATAVDACIMLENQFSGWSNCVNRFSWFKRTFSVIRRDVAAEFDVEKLNSDLNRFQSFIGAPPARPPASLPAPRASLPAPRPPSRAPALPPRAAPHAAAAAAAGNARFPIGCHLTGPLRDAVKKVGGHEGVLVAALRATAAAAAAQTPRAEAAQLRSLPFLLYLADGDVAPGSFNVFSENLKDVQKIFRRCAAAARPPARLRAPARAPASPADPTRPPPAAQVPGDGLQPARVGGRRRRRAARRGGVARARAPALPALHDGDRAEVGRAGRAQCLLRRAVSPRPARLTAGLGRGRGRSNIIASCSQTCHTLPYAGRLAAPPAISCPGSSPSVRSAFSFCTSS